MGTDAVPDLNFQYLSRMYEKERNHSNQNGAIASKPEIILSLLGNGQAVLASLDCRKIPH